MIVLICYIDGTELINAEPTGFIQSTGCSSSSITDVTVVAQGASNNDEVTGSRRKHTHNVTVSISNEYSSDRIDQKSLGIVEWGGDRRQVICTFILIAIACNGEDDITGN